jgi:DNA-binding protein Fis
VSVDERNPEQGLALDHRVRETVGIEESPLNPRIADSLDGLIDYLIAHEVKGIHPLIMGEVERRLVIKALERSRGNKARAAKTLGLGRNTFLRKVRALIPPCEGRQTGADEENM